MPGEKDGVRRRTAGISAAAPHVLVTRKKSPWKAMWQRHQHVVWCCAATIVILFGVLIFWLNPERQTHEIPVNDEELISIVNNRADFRGAASQQFNSWSLLDVKKAFGGYMLTTQMEMVPQCAASAAVTASPDEYDGRKSFPRCFHKAYPSGNCSSSVAVSVASTLASRLCIKDPTNFVDVQLSPQELLSCDRNSNGCKGSAIEIAYQYIQRSGLVTEQCMPYKGSTKSIRCADKCSDMPMGLRSFCRVEKSEKAVMREIISGGPVTGVMLLYDDFLVYKGGVYSPMKTAKRLASNDGYPLAHAVKILGWGTEGGRRHWIIENNFGPTWGEEGYGKISRDKVLVEGFVLAGQMKSMQDMEEEVKAAEEARKAMQKRREAAKATTTRPPATESEEKDDELVEEL